MKKALSVIASAIITANVVSLIPLCNVYAGQTMSNSVDSSTVNVDILDIEWPSYVTNEQKAKLYQLYTEVYGEQTYASTRAITYSYNECFDEVKWITRSGKISLSIMPKSPLYTQTMANAAMAVANHAWKLLAEKYSSDSYWDNEESMFAQFHCHVLAAGKYKTPWNIEPWRTETDLSVVIAKACNP